ncbi:hypothetical protein PHLCEN_2v7200 [Hermanssonia centrifuga]|uniref:Uncharacterized protein n=1 Tax=Hermanssonia centrifuga TaxID=98765 RepID=A0A2R6NX84_9APHY|nr:hypothetical protein PHLCEN_2v7200 [Hermanssonia centrifuga]
MSCNACDAVYLFNLDHTRIQSESAAATQAVQPSNGIKDESSRVNKTETKGKDPSAPSPVPATSTMFRFKVIRQLPIHVQTQILELYATALPPSVTKVRVGSSNRF